jgi:hypothetical protein
VSVRSIEILALERICLRWSSKHFLRKKPCKKSADLHPRRGNLPQRNILHDSTKTTVYNTT